MDAAAVLRAVRRARRMSQRDLAEHTRLPGSTISRIEAGHVDPRFTTIQRVVGSVGYRLAVIGEDGRPIALAHWQDDLEDSAGRHFPAHLPARKTPGYFDDGYAWWGWHIIAFPIQDCPGNGVVPLYTFSNPRRRRR